MRFSYAALIAVTLLTIGTAYVFYNALPKNTEHTVSAAVTTIPTYQPRTPPHAMREYRSVRYGFSLFYPEAMGVTEQDEGQGAMTVTFEDAASRQGFQIFIVPYNDTAISDERFLQDVPSGVRENVNSMSLDGVAAVMFDSTDEFVGETREVWLIANSHLYELTTMRPHGAWFDDALLSWEFAD